MSTGSRNPGDVKVKESSSSGTSILKPTATTETSGSTGQGYDDPGTSFNPSLGLHTSSMKTSNTFNTAQRGNETAILDHSFIPKSVTDISKASTKLYKAETGTEPKKLSSHSSFDPDAGPSSSKTSSKPREQKRNSSKKSLDTSLDPSRELPSLDRSKKGRGKTEVLNESNKARVYSDAKEQFAHSALKNIPVELFYYLFNGEKVKEIKGKLGKIDDSLEKNTHELTPKAEHVWTWFAEIKSIDNVKVVIMGEEPYKGIFKGIHQSDGLGFSINPAYMPNSKARISPSLENIMQFAAPKSSSDFTGDLRPWVEQGVLLLDVYLTATTKTRLPGEGKHRSCNWSFVTDSVLEKLGSSGREPTVFILMGKIAKERVIRESKKTKNISYKLVDMERHKVIATCHPVWREQMQKYMEGEITHCCCDRKDCWMNPRNDGSDGPQSVFQEANDFLQEKGREPIVWNCFGPKSTDVDYEMLQKKVDRMKL